MTGNTAKHIIFTGRVQGVGFRFTAHSIANRYRLAGFVRNLSDGTVEMFAQGSAEDIDDCIADMKENFSGYIRETKIEEIPCDVQYKDFNIRF
ncbi:MAG: acylphosphatase [Planctomycetota bacterium]|nr:MAG: acylphosphatase [Planctomycetota bacterium]